MIFLPLLFGCPDPDRGGNECTAEKACGWGETCENGFCVVGRCATSAECPVETYCEDDACLSGCRADTDCGPGTHCDLVLSTCAPNACQDTEIDCGFRQYCDTTSGTCFDAGEQFCRPCEEDVECGAGNLCFADYCGVDCNDRPCPSGFDCIGIDDNEGNIFTYQCITYCWLYPEYL